jgi:hypothetical protein
MFGAWGFGQGYFGQGPLEIPDLIIAPEYNTDWIVQCLSDDVAMLCASDDLVVVMAPDPVATFNEDSLVVVVPSDDATVVM